MKKVFFILLIMLIFNGKTRVKADIPVDLWKSYKTGGISTKIRHYKYRTNTVDKLKRKKERLENKGFIKVFRSVFSMLKDFLTKLLNVFNIFKKKKK